MLHELKTESIYFGAVKEGRKLFELRFNDRDYHVGDQLLLKEYSSEGTFTGEEVLVEVVYMYEAAEGDSFGMLPGWCAMGIRYIEQERRYAVAQYDAFEGDLSIEVVKGQEPVDILLQKLGLTRETAPLTVPLTAEGLSSYSYDCDTPLEIVEVTNG